MLDELPQFLVQESVVPRKCIPIFGEVCLLIHFNMIYAKILYLEYKECNVIPTASAVLCF